MRAADPSVQCGQRIQDAPAGGAQCPRERMHPQAVGQFLVRCRLMCLV
jgi:hypothetical protein